jgi:hypothetical protein
MQDFSEGALLTAPCNTHIVNLGKYACFQPVISDVISKMIVIWMISSERDTQLLESQAATEKTNLNL